MAYKYQGQNALTQLLTLLAGKFDTKVDKQTGYGLSKNDFTDDLKTKLEGVEAGANKYVHATHTAKAIDLYKVEVDGEGHVVSATKVSKEDITALGIPGQDTTYVVATTTKDGLQSAADKAKLDGIEEGANKYVHATHTEYDEGIYKFTVDGEGHVTSAVAITKADLAAIIGNASEQEAGLMPAASVTKLKGIAEGAQVNVIEEVQVNGVKQAPNGKVVNIAVPTGDLASKDQVTEDDLEAGLKAKVNAAAEGNHSHDNKALLDTYDQTNANLKDAVDKKHAHANAEELAKIANGDKAKWDTAAEELPKEVTRAKQAEQTNAAAAADALTAGQNAQKAADEAKAAAATNAENITKGDAKTLEDAQKYADEKIAAQIASAYKVQGSVAELPTASAETLGNVYNVSVDFTTTDAFVEGAGKSYPAGTNVVVVQSGESYKLDVLAGFIDLTPYLKKTDAANTYLTKTDASNTYVTKTEAEAFAKSADFEEITASEVQTAWNAVFGA